MQRQGPPFQLENINGWHNPLGSHMKYVVLPGKLMGAKYQDIYEEIFRFWIAQWQKTFSDLGINFAEVSDEFCRHEEITALLHEEKVIGCVLLDQFDLANQVHLKHHYFANYPKSVLEKLATISTGRPIMTVGYLALDPTYRQGQGVTDLILGLAVRRFLHSDCQALITYTRNTRRTHELTYRVGAIPVAQNISVRGEPSDFVYFDRTSIAKLNQHEHVEIMDKLWREKIFMESKNIQPINLNKGLKDEIGGFEPSL